MRSVNNAAFSLILGAACGDEPEPPRDPPDAQSAYVDLYLDEDIRACGRQLDAYDQFIERIFEVWTGSSPDDFRVDVHVSTEPRCPSSLSCADPHGVYLATRFGEYHELVHAMHFATDGLSAPSIDEGLAEALGPGHPLAGEGYANPGLAVDVLFEKSPTASAYGPYALLTRFLLDRHGADAYRTYFRGMADPGQRAPEDFEREFELAFGEYLDLAWSEFLLDADSRRTDGARNTLRGWGYPHAHLDRGCLPRGALRRHVRRDLDALRAHCCRVRPCRGYAHPHARSRFSVTDNGGPASGRTLEVARRRHDESNVSATT
jgi:hypothetical protein